MGTNQKTCLEIVTFLSRSVPFPRLPTPCAGPQPTSDGVVGNKRGADKKVFNVGVSSSKMDISVANRRAGGVPAMALASSKWLLDADNLFESLLERKLQNIETAVNESLDWLRSKRAELAIQGTETAGSRGGDGEQSGARKQGQGRSRPAGRIAASARAASLSKKARKPTKASQKAGHPALANGGAAALTGAAVEQAVSEASLTSPPKVVLCLDHPRNPFSRAQTRATKVRTKVPSPAPAAQIRQRFWLAKAVL